MLQKDHSIKASAILTPNLGGNSGQLATCLEALPTDRMEKCE